MADLKRVFGWFVLTCLGLIGVVIGIMVIGSTDAPLIASSQRAIAAEMTDPDSTTFRGVWVHKDRGAFIVCGELNARNRMGGMNGFTPFAYFVGGRDPLLIAGNRGMSVEQVRIACGVS